MLLLAVSQGITDLPFPRLTALTQWRQCLTCSSALAGDLNPKISSFEENVELAMLQVRRRLSGARGHVLSVVPAKWRGWLGEVS